MGIEAVAGGGVVEIVVIAEIEAAGAAAQVIGAGLAVGEGVEGDVAVVDVLRALDLLDLEDVELGGAGVADRALGDAGARQRVLRRVEQLDAAGRDVVADAVAEVL